MTEFAYDPFGRRILKKVTQNGASTATHYFYDNGDILFEYDDAGTIGNHYTHGIATDEHLRVDTGKGKYYYHADGLGSIIAVTDTAGTVAQTYQYDSFGNRKDQKNRVKQPYSYTGREWDKEIGLYYYRARYYDPIDGRFINKDPFGFRGGMNLYGYVEANPINLTDPSGLDPIGPSGRTNDVTRCHVNPHNDRNENLLALLSALGLTAGPETYAIIAQYYPYLMAAAGTQTGQQILKNTPEFIDAANPASDLPPNMTKAGLTGYAVGQAINFIKGLFTN